MLVVDMCEKLKNLRLNHHLTQPQVAKRLGMSNGTISSYENGTRYPSLTALVKLAALYHVTTDYLLGYDNAVLPESRQINVDGLSENEIRIVAELVEALKLKNN